MLKRRPLQIKKLPIKGTNTSFQEMTNPHRYRLQMFLLGVTLILLYLTGDIFIDTYVFHVSPLFQQIFFPDADEIWNRILACSLLGFLTYFSAIALQISATSEKNKHLQLEERQQAESKLKDMLSILNATLDSTLDGILLIDLNGKVEVYNRRFLELWKIPAEIVASKDDAKLLGFVMDQLRKPEDFIHKVKELYSQPEAESFDILEFIDGRFFERPNPNM
jgi:PAS domain-containing protein